jgi:hypothetical protein
MDITSDYGSDVWGSNPYGPTTFSKALSMNVVSVFCGIYRLKPSGWP